MHISGALPGCAPFFDQPAEQNARWINRNQPAAALHNGDCAFGIRSYLAQSRGEIWPQQLCFGTTYATPIRASMLAVSVRLGGYCFLYLRGSNGLALSPQSFVRLRYVRGLYLDSSAREAFRICRTESFCCHVLFVRIPKVRLRNTGILF